MTRALGPFRFVVPREAGGTRLDRFLAGLLPVSRSELQRWIEAGTVRVGSREGEAAMRVREGDEVVVVPLPPPATTARAQTEVRFEVLFQDEALVVVNKPAGLVVHPAKGHEDGTLVNGLLGLGIFRAEMTAGLRPGRSPVETSESEDTRPGIVHRLDRGTSGVMVVARTPEARERLKTQFQAHTIERMYEAIAVGEATGRTFSTLYGRHPRYRQRFTSRVKTGKRAVTRTRVLARLDGATHLECTLETGRTHQIRVHLAESGTPVLGDPLYGKPPRDPAVRELGERLGHQALHARVLGFVHPGTGERVRFEAEPPDDFRHALEVLGSRGVPRRTPPR